MSYVHVIVDVGVQSALEAVAATPVVVVIVADAHGPGSSGRRNGSSILILVLGQYPARGARHVAPRIWPEIWTLERISGPCWPTYGDRH